MVEMQETWMRPGPIVPSAPKRSSTRNVAYRTIQHSSRSHIMIIMRFCGCSLFRWLMMIVDARKSSTLKSTVDTLLLCLLDVTVQRDQDAKLGLSWLRCAGWNVKVMKMSLVMIVMSLCLLWMLFIAVCFSCFFFLDVSSMVVPKLGRQRSPQSRRADETSLGCFFGGHQDAMNHIFCGVCF